MKRVLLLAVSCKNCGLCPGGIDLDNPSEWIRIVRGDGSGEGVQGHEIDFARPLDIIEFEGHPMPQGAQRENWVIDNHSCRKIGTEPISRIQQAYREYGYHKFWNNGRSYLTQDELDELERIACPSESIMVVTDVRIYKNEYNKAKIDFRWLGIPYLIKGVSMTDQDFYSQICEQDVCFKFAYIVVSIPSAANWIHPETGEQRGYKFVSRIFSSDKYRVLL